MRPLHVVAAENVESGETIVITAYEPDREEWEQDFKKGGLRRDLRDL